MNGFLRPRLVSRCFDPSFGAGRPARTRILLPKRLLTLGELAIYLDVSGVELCELIEHEDSQKFPAIRIGDEWYVALDDVPEWLLRLSDKPRT